MTPSSDRLNRTIADVYASIGRGDGFDSALRSTRNLLNASGGMLFTPALDVESGGFGFVDQIVPDFFIQYRAYYYDKDPWAEAGARKRLDRGGTTLTDDMLTSQGELSKAEIYADMIRWGTTRLCCSVLVGYNDPTFPATHISLYRGPDERPFGPDDRKQLALIAPHLRQALKLARQLRFSINESDDLRQVLHDLNRGVLLVDESKGVIFANRAAERLCSGAWGVVIRRDPKERPSLHAVRAREDAVVQKALDAAIELSRRDYVTMPGAGPAPIPIRRTASDQLLIVTVAPLRSPLQPGFPARSRAIVYLEDVGQSHEPREGVCMLLFGFTPAEARLARALTLGEEPKSIASDFGVSEATVRTQIRSLFAKTNTHRLASLIALLVRVGETQASCGGNAACPRSVRSG